MAADGPIRDQGRILRRRHFGSTIPADMQQGDGDRATVDAAIVDETELGQLARLVARLTPGQQRLVVALADGFRGGWLEPLQWERAWQGSDLTNDGVLGDARTWLARRPGQPRDRLDQVGWPPNDGRMDGRRRLTAGRLANSG
jgi:hypothetical protein